MRMGIGGQSGQAQDSNKRLGNQSGKLSTQTARRNHAKTQRRTVSASTEPLRTVILIGIHVLTLDWGDVDFRRGQITVQAIHAKNGESRTVPMNTVLKEALTRLRERSDGSGRVFVSRSGQPFRSIRTQFTTACRNAKLADVTPHTLRHTFASRLSIAGVGLRTIQELGGWEEIRMVLRYAHLSDQHKADAVERITGKIAEIPLR
jgi:integrase